METLLTSITINTGRTEQILRFYGRLGLEFQAKNVSKGGQCHKTFVGALEITFFGVKETANSRFPDLQLTFRIADLEKVVADLTAIDGVQCIMDPTILPDGKKAILLDPDGRSIELIEST